MKALVGDPFVTTVILGTLWPLVQASLDRPWWTKRRRVALVVAAAVALTTGTWALSAYPLQAELLAGQIGKFLGFAWAAYQVLSRIRIGGVSILGWAGIITPGGETRETYRPRHEAA